MPRKRCSEPGLGSESGEEERRGPDLVSESDEDSDEIKGRLLTPIISRTDGPLSVYKESRTNAGLQNTHEGV